MHYAARPNVEEVPLNVRKTSRNRRTLSYSVAVIAMLALSCGGDSSSPGGPNPAPTPTPTPTLATPTPTPAPTATPTPDASSKCGNLAPGPVARVAIAPRRQREGASQGDVDMMVRAKPNFDEVWCVDKDKEQILDINVNQRDANGKECCWVNDPVADFDDPENVVSSFTQPHPYGFIIRVRLKGNGRTGTVSVWSKLDGQDSYPWQSGSGYRQEPLRIELMSKNQIQDQCQCIYKGNAVYEGTRCPK